MSRSRIWLGGPHDGQIVEVPDEIKYLEVKQFKGSLNKMGEPNLNPEDASVPTETLWCEITPKYVIWPYPKKPNGPPEKVEV